MHNGFATMTGRNFKILWLCWNRNCCKKKKIEPCHVKNIYCLLSIWKLTNGFSVISANKSSLMELKVFPKKCSSKRKCENSIYKNVNLQFDKRLGFVSSFLSPQLKSIHFDSRWGLSTYQSVKRPIWKNLRKL